MGGIFLSIERGDKRSFEGFAERGQELSEGMRLFRVDFNPSVNVFC